MSIPGLPRGTRSRVFRRIVDQLKTDPVLRTVVKTWETWDGDAPDQLPDAAIACPYIKLLPQLGPVGWYSPDAMLGPLEIAVQVGAEGLDANDPIDLWDAFERAIYPYDDHDKQLAFEKALRDLGAETGQIEFSRPASIQGLPDANNSLQFLCLGMMRINVIRAFNP